MCRGIFISILLIKFVNKRDTAILLRLIQLAAILGVLIYGIAAIAGSSEGTSFLGISNKLFFGGIGMMLVIYVALSFSKFMFKNLPSAYDEEKGEMPEDASWKAAGRMAEIKYGAKKEKRKSEIDKYYSVGKKR